MWRFYYTIIRNIFKLPNAIKTMEDLIKKSIENPNNYNEQENYKYVQYIIDVMQKTGFIKTEVFDTENLPKNTGYMMYPNHQGKYDVYSIISVHSEPCSFVMDEKKSNSIFIKQIIDTLKGKRLSKENNRQAMKIINEVTEEIKLGRKYILFPEGSYDNKKKNNLIDFKSGCFKTSINSKTPIIPVVLIDTYKVYNSWNLGKITTQVHYLKPIYYDEYKDLNTQAISKLVKSKIENKIKELQKKT